MIYIFACILFSYIYVLIYPVMDMKSSKLQNQRSSKLIYEVRGTTYNATNITRKYYKKGINSTVQNVKKNLRRHVQGKFDNISLFR